MRKLLIILTLPFFLTACNSTASDMLSPDHFQRTVNDVFSAAGQLVTGQDFTLFHDPNDITHILDWGYFIAWDEHDQIVPHNSDFDQRFAANPFVGTRLRDWDRAAFFEIDPNQVASPGITGMTGAGVNPNEAMLGGSAPLTREGYFWPISGSGAIHINRFVGIASGGKFSPFLTVNASARNVYAMADGEILFAGELSGLDGWDDVFSGSYAMIISFDPVTLPPLRDRGEAPPALDDREDYFIIPFNNLDESNQSVRHTAMFFGLYNISNLPELRFHDEPSTASWANIGDNVRLGQGDRIRQGQTLGMTARHNGFLGVVVLDGTATVSYFSRSNLTPYIVQCMLRHMFNHIDAFQASFGIQGRAIITSPSTAQTSDLNANQRRFNRNSFSSAEWY